jgi:hypothetical protein
MKIKLRQIKKSIEVFNNIFEFVTTNEDTTTMLHRSHLRSGIDYMGPPESQNHHQKRTFPEKKNL